METNNNVERQVVLRSFMPDINTLKSTAKRISAVPGAQLNLYAKAGEVLVVITSSTHTTAAASELCEGAARRFEADLGDAVYARGKVTLAQTAVLALARKNRLVCAADAATGELLGEQMLTAKNVDAVYDFGHDSYDSEMLGSRLARRVYEAQSGANLADAANAMAVAAQKCTKTDYGVAFTGLDGEKGVVVAVAAKYCVYIARVAAGEDAGKQAALMALDIMRRDMLKLDQPQARMFAKNKPVIWNHPMKNRSRLPLLITILVLLAVVAGLWWVSYKLTWFDAPASASSAPASSMVTGADSTGSSTAAQPASSTATDAGNPSQSYAAADDGTVRPFA